jgi:predicted nucleic acid-binding protein
MLVDTNVLSELPRPRPNANVVRWFSAQATIHVSVVTLEELSFGVARAGPGARSRLGRWLDALLGARPVIHDVTATILAAWVRALHPAAYVIQLTFLCGCRSSFARVCPILNNSLR